MKIRTAIFPGKKLIGMRMPMNYIHHQPGALWGRFMPRRGEITAATGTLLYSLEIYPPGYFRDFRPDTFFEKWAAMEVHDFANIPDDMEPLVVPAGLYVTFIYKGIPEKSAAIYRYIFREWLPESTFSVDNRPHFAVMGEKYRAGSNDSEEEIWIPVKQDSE